MITLEVGGRRYNNFTEVNIERALDAISGVFYFQAASDYKLPFPIPRGQAVKVYVNDSQVITGYVDRIKVSYDSNTHTISIEGRDKTADIVDSKVDHKIEFVAPISLEDIATQTLAAIGATDVSVINKVEGLEPFLKGDLISANIGQSAFDFLDMYAKKKQVITTTDGLGNLVFSRASTVSTDVQLNNIVGGTLNTIKSASVSYDDSERFNEYTFYSQGNPGGDKDVGESSKQLTDRTGTYTDPEVRTSRQYHEVSESSSKEATLDDRAKWEGQIRKAKSFRYNCTVVGHSPVDSGEAYTPNTLVRVKDDFADVNDELLLFKVTSRVSSSGGSTTDLEMLTKEAFNVLLAQKARELAKKDTKSNSKNEKQTIDKTKFTDYDNTARDFFYNDFKKR